MTAERLFWKLDWSFAPSPCSPSAKVSGLRACFWALPASCSLQPACFYIDYARAGGRGRGSAVSCNRRSILRSNSCCRRSSVYSRGTPRTNLSFQISGITDQPTGDSYGPTSQGPEGGEGKNTGATHKNGWVKSVAT